MHVRKPPASKNVKLLISACFSEQTATFTYMSGRRLHVEIPHPTETMASQGKPNENRNRFLDSQKASVFNELDHLIATLHKQQQSSKGGGIDASAMQCAKLYEELKIWKPAMTGKDVEGFIKKERKARKSAYHECVRAIERTLKNLVKADERSRVEEAEAATESQDVTKGTDDEEQSLVEPDETEVQDPAPADTALSKRQSRLAEKKKGNKSHAPELKKER